MAIVCRAPRDVVIVQGDDAATFLHSQLANDITTLLVGTCVHSFVLEPTGHVVAIARVFRYVDTVFTLDVDAGLGDAVVSRLRKFVLRAKVAMRMSDWSVHTYWDDDIAHRLAGVPGVAKPWWGDNDAFDVISAPDHDLPISLDECVRADENYWHSSRADAHWPFVGRDVEVGDVPATTGVVRVAASFTKGCYPGQELVERMDSRGTAAPVTVRALDKVDHGDINVGDQIIRGGVAVANVTSVGERWALARVKRGEDIGVDLGAA